MKSLGGRDSHSFFRQHASSSARPLENHLKITDSYPEVITTSEHSLKQVHRHGPHRTEGKPMPSGIHPSASK